MGKKFLFIVGSIILSMNLYGNNIHPYDTTDVKVDLQLVGSLRVKTSDMDFGIVPIGTGPIEKISKIEIEEIGSTSSLPIGVEFFSQGKKLQRLEEITITNGENKIPILLDWETKDLKLKKGKVTTTLIGKMENKDKDIKEGIYTGNVTVRIKYNDL